MARKCSANTSATNRQGEPGHAATWYWPGQLLEKQGRRAEAKSSYSKAIALAPGDKDVTEALKRVS